MLTQALTAAQRIGDTRSQSEHLGNLGIAHEDLGEFESSRNCLSQEVLKLCQRLIHSRFIINLQFTSVRLVSPQFLSHVSQKAQPQGRGEPRQTSGRRASLFFADFSEGARSANPIGCNPHPSKGFSLVTAD